MVAAHPVEIRGIEGSRDPASVLPRCAGSLYRAGVTDRRVGLITDDLADGAIYFLPVQRRALRTEIDIALPIVGELSRRKRGMSESMEAFARTFVASKISSSPRRALPWHIAW